MPSIRRLAQGVVNSLRFSEYTPGGTTSCALLAGRAGVAQGYEGKPTPRILELIEHAGYLVDGVERAMDTPIEPTSSPKRAAGTSDRS